MWLDREMVKQTDDCTEMVYQTDGWTDRWLKLLRVEQKLLNRQMVGQRGENR